jgi:Alpha-kinase family
VKISAHLVIGSYHCDIFCIKPHNNCGAVYISWRQHCHYNTLSSNSGKFTMSVIAADFPTSAIAVVETEHGRLRRKQRGIDKKDLQSAMKYGTRTSTHPRPNGDPVGIYTYKDIVYIVNERTMEEVTTYATPFELDKVNITSGMQNEHDNAVWQLQNDRNCWKSHTVIIVDTSGSMKSADVWGARNRLKGVWISIALDFIAQRIEACEATTLDVVSIVTLREEPEVIALKQPCDYILYNKIVSIYNEALVSASGHGPFLPALEEATRLLVENDCSSSALSLALFTDGRPSDHWGTDIPKEDFYERIVQRVVKLAEQFGSRFSFTVMPVGDYKQFNLLKKMVDQAQEYGSKACVKAPSMSLVDLATAMTSVVTSVTESQIELTDPISRQQRKIRALIRESKSQAARTIRFVNHAEFEITHANKVQRTVYKEWLVNRVRHSELEQIPLQNQDAAYVAVCKKPFGEGGERFAHRFYEVASDGVSIVGKPLVAKESRFVVEDENKNDNGQARHRFVKEFCKGQQLALRLADEFNARLDQLHRVDDATPRVSFLNCSVYKIEDLTGKLKYVLVEDRLDETKWHKWNSNNGYVEGMSSKPTFTSEQLNDAMSKQRNLDLITEEDEEEESDDDNDHDSAEQEDDDGFTQVRGRRQNKVKRPIVFTPSEVAQAFSHFTYWASARKRLICDLQGVHDEETNMLVLSDPVIHYHSDFDSSSRPYRRYGDGNHGRNGMAKFFATHECSFLCWLTTRGLKQHQLEREERQRHSHGYNHHGQHHGQHHGSSNRVSRGHY